MSAFEVAVTPPRLKNARTISANREPTQVVMGLFSAKSVVTFEDIPITKTARRLLHVHNPTEDALKILLTKSIKPEANVSFQWTSNEIPPKNFIEMEIVWNPMIAWSSREIIQFTDNRNFTKDVVVVLKSVDKRSKSLLKKSIRASYDRPVTKKLTMKSPSPRTKQRLRIALAAKNSAARRITSTVVSSPVAHTVESERNNALQSKVLGENFISETMVKRYNGTKHEEKENQMPATPSQASNIFEAFKFTPVGHTKLNRSNVDFLASLPTPGSGTKNRPVPAQLNVHEFPLSPSNYNAVNRTTTINNQTMTLCDSQTPNQSMVGDRNVNHSFFADQKTPSGAGEASIERHFTMVKTLNFNEEISPGKAMLSASIDSERYSPQTNRTHVVSSPIAFPNLSVIQEEYTRTELSETYVKPTATPEHQRTYNMADALAPTPGGNLSRDVQLVGTPLMKKYQSMRELGQTNQSLSLEQLILKSNQGSMPNLNKIETMNSIENNRYFYQSVEKDLQTQTEVMSNGNGNRNDCATVDDEHGNGDVEYLGDTSICSIKSTVSTQSVVFKEHEILAQSSQFNLHEIDKGRMSSAFMKPICFSIDNFSTTSTSSQPMRPPISKQKSSLSSSSPSLNSGMKSSRSTRDLSSNSAHTSFVRPSVITFARSKSSISSVTPSKKRANTLNTSKKSIVKQEPESPKPSKGQAFRTNTWGGIMPKKFCMPSIPPQKLLLKRQSDERVVLFDPELHIKGVINPDPFAATTTFDPFLSATMYLDDEAVERHEIQFKKWLNALVTIPEDIAETTQKIDLGKLFNEVRNKDISLAPTKETVSSNYLTKMRMSNLRNAAIELYMGNEMRQSLEKVLVHVEKKAIQIRQDRNLHLDVVLQRQILELLLNFNPLWLRIGLEVVFGEVIPMQSNHDIVSLSAFILNRLFRDRYLEAKHPKVYSHSEAYAEHIKKFSLKKILSLIYFLDVAKNKKIIKHNPCLFLKTSEHKEIKDILLRFSSSLLGNIGDILRDLRRIGIVLTHKQTYIDEFDYAFRNLAIDLRDGVRLTKIMEIILLRDNLTCQLRVPAISRTQRVHNVGVALKALENAEFNLSGKITAADIADGHREKTLSLLWQIIYRFRAPKFHEAARVIQIWWRKNWLGVYIRRRIHDKREAERQEMAAIKVQKWVRGWLARKRSQNKMKSIVLIQRWYRNQMVARQQHQVYSVQRRCAIVIQEWFRRHLLARRIEALVPVIQEVKCQQIVLRKTILIQRKFRSTLLMKRQHTKYVELRRSAILVQRHFRAKIAMRENRKQFLLVRESTLKIQRFFRGYLEMKSQRHKLLAIRTAALTIQRKFHAQQLMIKNRTNYIAIRQSTTTIQRCFRAHLLRVEQRGNFLKIRSAAIVIQQRFRATLEMKRKLTEYLKVRSATIVIQRRWHARQLMKQQVRDYTASKESITCLQRHIRATVLMWRVRNEYQLLRASVLNVQRRFRATLEMQKQHSKYAELRRSVVLIQQRFRAVIAMREGRKQFIMARESTIKIQRFFRGYLEMKSKRDQLLAMRAAAVTIQRKFHAQQLMKRDREHYSVVRQSTITIQRCFRAHLLRVEQRGNFLKIRSAAIAIQKRFRAILEMRRHRTEYLEVRSATIVIQRRLRANTSMKYISNEYQLLRSLVICIQRKFRAQKAMRIEREKFLRMKQAAGAIQRFFRARQNQLRYQKLVHSTISMQAQIRGFLARKRFQELMTPEQIEHRRQIKAAKIIQSFWRGWQVRKKCSAKLRVIRENAKKLRENVNSENIVRNRVQGIIGYLRQRFAIREALNILRELERFSRTIPHTLIGDSRFIAMFCYGIMSQAIRSEADKPAISLCCRILLNLARYRPTQENAFQIHSFETVSQLLYRWCDKECDIFNVLCTLIWVFVQNPSINRSIREFMMTREALFLVRETKKLVERKERMRINNPSPWMPIMSQKEKSLMPMLETNYGVNTKINNYMFNSSLFAFETLLKILNIHL